MKKWLEALILTGDTENKKKDGKTVRNFKQIDDRINTTRTKWGHKDAIIEAVEGYNRPHPEGRWHTQYTHTHIYIGSGKER